MNLFRVVAARPIFNKGNTTSGKKLVGTSRLDFQEYTEVDYKEYYSQTLREFKDWVINVSTCCQKGKR
jgi:hypothetical protein